MKVAIAADHAGFAAKATVVEAVRTAGHEPIDLGTHSTEPVDYPDQARAVALAIQRREADRGIVLCGSGVGAAIAANKMRGVRAGVCHDTYSAHQAVEHDDMNVLTLGARVVGLAVIPELVAAFLRARFVADEPRYARRLAKVQAMEDGSGGGRT
ncbi:MAG: ribose 5-phosphate isomerase B [Candidatus Binatia bacterium]